MIQVTMTVVEQSKDERSEPKVSVYLVEFPNIDYFLDELSDWQASDTDNPPVVLKMTPETVGEKLQHNYDPNTNYANKLVDEGIAHRAPSGNIVLG
jgi:hypothetical protein